MSSWWPRSVRTDESSAAGLQLRQTVDNIPAATSSLVVIGAHYFGDDLNDPIKNMVRRLGWSTALLVEASPIIASELRERVLAANPLPRVPPSRVLVSNVGIRDSAHKSNRTVSSGFFTLTARDGGLPAWSTQIGSFNRQRVLAMLPYLEQHSLHRHGNWTHARLLKSLLRHTVIVRTLVGELRHRATSASTALLRPAVLLIDTEGLDCRIVAAQDWCVEPLDRVALLIFEFKHCYESAYRRALVALARCPWFGVEPTFADQENAFYLANVTTQERVHAGVLRRRTVRGVQPIETPGLSTRVLRLSPGRSAMFSF